MQQEAMQRMPVDLGTLPHQDRTIPTMIRPIPRPKLGTVVRQTDIQTIPCALGTMGTGQPPTRSDQRDETPLRGTIHPLDGIDTR